MGSGSPLDAAARMGQVPSPSDVGGRPAAGVDDLGHLFDEADKILGTLGKALKFEDEKDANVVLSMGLKLDKIRQDRDRKLEDKNRLEAAAQIRSQLP